MTSGSHAAANKNVLGIKGSKFFVQQQTATTEKKEVLMTVQWAFEGGRLRATS